MVLIIVNENNPGQYIYYYCIVTYCVYFIFSGYLCSYEIINDIIRDNKCYHNTVYIYINCSNHNVLLSLVVDSYFEDYPCSIIHSSCSFRMSLVAMFFFFIQLT